MYCVMCHVFCVVAMIFAIVPFIQTELVAMEEKIKAIEEEVEADKRQGALKDLSQKELEDKIGIARDELEEAKSNKEFAKCSGLQVSRYDQHFRALRYQRRLVATAAPQYVAVSPSRADAILEVFGLVSRLFFTAGAVSCCGLYFVLLLAPTYTSMCILV